MKEVICPHCEQLYERCTAVWKFNKKSVGSIGYFDGARCDRHAGHPDEHRSQVGDTRYAWIEPKTDAPPPPEAPSPQHVHEWGPEYLAQLIPHRHCAGCGRVEMNVSYDTSDPRWIACTEPKNHQPPPPAPPHQHEWIEDVHKQNLADPHRFCYECGATQYRGLEDLGWVDCFGPGVKAGRHQPQPPSGGCSSGYLHNWSPLYKPANSGSPHWHTCCAYCKKAMALGRSSFKWIPCKSARQHAEHQIEPDLPEFINGVWTPRSTAHA